MQEMTDQMWRVAHTLAADLALSQVSKNLVQQAAGYVRQAAQASLADYLDRLEQLGDYFAAGKGGPLERVDLRRVLQRVKKWPQNVGETLAILRWTARLVGYYECNRQDAAARCGLDFVSLRQGDHYSGVVRDRHQDTVWVVVAPGQWGRASYRYGVEIGDEVEVAVTRVTDSPVQFDVEIVSVKQRAVSVPEQRKVPAEVVAPPESKGEEPDAISKRAAELLESFQKTWAEEEETDGE